MKKWKKRLQSIEHSIDGMFTVVLKSYLIQLKQNKKLKKIMAEQAQTNETINQLIDDLGTEFAKVNEGVDSLIEEVLKDVVGQGMTTEQEAVVEQRLQGFKSGLKALSEKINGVPKGEPAPVEGEEPIPVDETPTEPEVPTTPETPEVPVEETPTEETPTTPKAPVEETPVEEPVTETPVETPPAEEVPAEETPVTPELPAPTTPEDPGTTPVQSTPGE